MKPLKNVSLTKLYICNRKMCGSKCHYPDCKHTSNPEYALYPKHNWKNAEIFINNPDGVYHVDLWEVAECLPDFNNLGSLLRMPN